jgi:2,3-bisphosphoglycerate-independent phosphoglycerate mutase
MSAPEVTEKMTAAIRSQKFDLIVLNYANPDMVGHTGILEAAIKAVEEVDRGLGQIITAIDEVGGALLVIADHGNCEQMMDTKPASRTRRTPPTLSRAFSMAKGFGNEQAARRRSSGDVSPTLLQLMQVEQSPAMSESAYCEPATNSW